MERLVSEPKTEAMKIMEARHGSYADYPSGFYDETDLLLMSQHVSELNARKKAKAPRRNKRRKRR